MIDSKSITLTKQQQLFIIMLGETKQAICFSEQKKIMFKHRQNFKKIVNPLVETKILLKTLRQFNSRYKAMYYELTIEGLCLYKHLKQIQKARK